MVGLHGTAACFIGHNDLYIPTHTLIHTHLRIYVRMNIQNSKVDNNDARDDKSLNEKK